MFYNGKKGKIIINLESENEKVNSSMEYRGIARKSEIALTTLLINFVSLSLEKGKNPEELIDKHLKSMINTIKKGKIIGK